MYIDDALFNIEIIGTEDNSCLKLNNTTMVCRGTREYCLSTREEILVNRGYTVPKDWDLSWSVHRKSTWTPSQLSSLACHLTPDTYSLSTDTGNPEDVTEWADDTDNGILFKPKKCCWSTARS